MPEALTPLVLAAAVTAAGLLPTDGTQAAYRLELGEPSAACGWKGAPPASLVVHLGSDSEGAWVAAPSAIPEQLGLSPVTRGELVGASFGGTREDRYALDRLGTLRLSKSLNLTGAEGGALTGSLVVEAEIDFLEEAPPEVRAATGPLASGPCTSTTALTGTPIDSEPVDPEHVDRIWGLLKAHMDALLTRGAERSLEPLEEGLAIEGPHRSAFLWRKSRAMFVMGEEMERSDREGRLAIFSTGQEVAKEALALDPSSAEAAFFQAAHLGRYNTTHGMISLFFGLDDFERLAQTTLELGSDYDMMGFKVTGDAHHALGQFYRLVPDSLMMEMLAGVRGNLETSVGHHRQAVEIQTDRGDYWKELGVALSCFGVRNDDPEAIAEGRQALEKATTMQVWAYSNPELDREHAARLMDQPEDTCRYSRDLY